MTAYESITELKKAMIKIAVSGKEPFMKSYQIDLVHDFEKIDQSDNGDVFIWMLRTTGTDLHKVSENVRILASLPYNEKFYCINIDEMRLHPIKEKDLRKCVVCYSNECQDVKSGTSTKCCSDRGISSNDGKCKVCGKW